MPLFSVIALCALAATQASQAAAIINLVQVGNDVVGTGSGTLNLTGLSFFIASSGTSGIVGTLGYVCVGPVASTTISTYTGFTGPITFGAGAFTGANSGAVDMFGIRAQTGVNQLTVPSGYLSGTDLSGNATWSNTTFAGLGIKPGTYTWNWGSGPTADSLTLNVVPEPTSALFQLGSVLPLLRRRRA